GDTSFARTRDRLELVNHHRVDAVVVLTPYFTPFTQDELVDYYRALADFALHPLYLYDLPALTGVKLDMETVEHVAEHPNIHGIKCSCEWDWTRQLIERMGDRFRVIVAQPRQVDRLIREGVGEQLDGIFSAAPEWTIALGRAADAGDWATAAELQGRISGLLDVYAEFGGLPAYSAMLNARGVPGNFAPAPFRPLSESRREQLLAHPLVRQLLADCLRPTRI
ncbi:MAG: dihydrodipicolinate synthase family protein, partial [Planctomycetota bacterium]